MERTELHTHFMDELHSGKRAVPATRGHLEEIEAGLGTVLPVSYVEFMSSQGGAFTPSVLGLILDRGILADDLQEICGAWDLIERNRGYWVSGMPRDLVSFGNDCMGNAFCFRVQSEGAGRPDDLAVWFFDHDRIEWYEVSPSFDAFLESLLQLKCVEPLAVA
jgi:hypothetical protein